MTEICQATIFDTDIIPWEMPPCLGLGNLRRFL